MSLLSLLLASQLLVASQGVLRFSPSFVSLFYACTSPAPISLLHASDFISLFPFSLSSSFSSPSSLVTPQRIAVSSRPSPTPFVVIEQICFPLGLFSDPGPDASASLGFRLLWKLQMDPGERHRIIRTYLQIRVT